jgi:hypothetical protein
VELTQKQIDFLNEVCRGVGKWKLNLKGEVDVDGSVSMYCMKLTEMPVKFGEVSGWFDCSGNQLTTLKNCPTSVGNWLDFSHNPLADYFKNIKEEDFPHWKILNWILILNDYPFLVNIGKKYTSENDLKYILKSYPLTKLYLE